MIDFSAFRALSERFLRPFLTDHAPGMPDHLPPGPPAIATARRLAARRSNVVIDPLETEFRSEQGRLLVRSWLVIPAGSISPTLFDAIVATDERMRNLEPEAREIFFLSASYGLSTSQIARLCGHSRHKTRRWLLKAIARLDRRPL